jgi:hypothetical protein
MEYAKSLSKDVLVALFRAFPGDFVLIGGGALHWIFGSPRLSVDLDLKPVKGARAGLLEEMAGALNARLVPAAQRLGVTIACRADAEAGAVKIEVNHRPALQVELVELAPITGKEKHLLQTDALDSEVIVTPDVHQLLFAKTVALIKRPQLKGRDVFDIWFLQSRRANLDPAKFRDWLSWEEISPDDLRKVIARITPARLRSDLQRFLPDSVRTSLEEDDFRPLIAAVEELLEPFL